MKMTKNRYYSWKNRGFFPEKKGDKKSLAVRTKHLEVEKGFCYKRGLFSMQSIEEYWQSEESSNKKSEDLKIVMEKQRHMCLGYVKAQPREYTKTSGVSVNMTRSSLELIFKDW